MATYRKKPVVVRAWLASDLRSWAANNWKLLPAQIAEQYEKGQIIFGANVIFIETLEGRMIAQPTDMVICGVNGEFYPCKPDIFAQTYEEA